ncbi:D-alanine-D-alanine ligase [Ruaniaceae bacterium KH17]|nr:D-alanine-D-alanine ligase [Ruaniaceae bacterium KH17]
MSGDKLGAMSTAKARVAVIFGGKSGEHPVSCATAAGVLRAIDRERFEVVPIGITREGAWVLMPDAPELLEGGTAEVSEVTTALGSVVVDSARTSELVEIHGEAAVDLGPIEVVLPLLHGPFGEDGTIQGFFEMTDVRYVGSGVLASALAMDKHFTKIALRGAGLPVAQHVLVSNARWRHERQAVLAESERLGLPLFVKPSRAGSSLGITRVTDFAELPAAIEAAREHDPKVIVEAALSGREIECGVIGGRDGGTPRVAPLGEVVMHSQTSDWYDYETKYFDSDGFSMVCPADLPEAVAERVQEMAVAAFQALDCEGLARVDFFVDDDGTPTINEINTMPGFTPYSMFPVMWQKAGLSYPELVTELIELALQRPLGLR